MIFVSEFGVHPSVARPREAADGRHQRLAGELHLEFLGDDVPEAIAMEFLEHGREGAFELDGGRRMQPGPRKLGKIGHDFRKLLGVNEFLHHDMLVGVALERGRPQLVEVEDHACLPSAGTDRPAMPSDSVTNGACPPVFGPDRPG